MSSIQTYRDDLKGRLSFTASQDKPAPEKQPLINHYLAILRRRRMLVASIAVVVLALAIAVTFSMTPQYTSTTRLEIQRESTNIVRVGGVEPESHAVDLEFYQTQYGLLESPALAERVAKDMRLADNADFFTMFGSEGRKWFENGRLTSAAPASDIRIREAGRVLLTRIVVEPVRLSSLVTVSFTSPRAEFSQRVLGAWTRNFIATTLERRVAASEYARRYLESGLTELRSKIDQSERKLVQYAGKEQIINLPASSENGKTVGERSILAQDLETLNTALLQATADRVRAESRVQPRGGAVTEALENQAIGGLRQKRAELSAEYQRMLVQFEPNYPPALALRGEIRDLDASIAREEGRVGGSLSNTYSSALQRERELQARVNVLKAQLLDQRERSIQYGIYQRDVDTNRQLYDAMLQRYKEIGVASGIGVTNIAEVDPPTLPEHQSSPRLFLNILVGLFLGLGLGISVALIVDQLADSIDDAETLKAVTGLPTLGIVPFEAAAVQDAFLDRKSNLAEAYLSIQAGLALATDHGAPKTLLVTSTAPAEGKSTTALGIAITLARVGRNVVVIDADLRSPSLHTVTSTNNQRGLSNYLAGEDNLPTLVQTADAFNISVIPAGPTPPNAAELIASNRMEMLMAELLKRFDNVVVDAPPLLALADAPLLASRVEGVVYVVRAHSSRARGVRAALQRLSMVRAHVFGTVLTHYKSSSAGYGSAYGYGYGYGPGKTD